MEISILYPGNISPVHLSLLIPVARLQRRMMILQGWLLLQAAALEPVMDEREDVAVTGYPKNP